MLSLFLTRGYASGGCLRRRDPLHLPGVKSRKLSFPLLGDKVLKMRNSLGSALLCLLLWPPSSLAEDETGSRERESETGPALVRVSMMDHARLIQDAELRIRFLVGRGLDSGALFDAIRAEPEPAAREAQWSEWLDSLAVSGAGGLLPMEVQTLAALEKASPVVGIPHHEFPSRTIPAFTLAARAAALLARSARLSRAQGLAARPNALAGALKAEIGSPAFGAGLQALELVSPKLLASLVKMQSDGSSYAPSTARIMLKAAEVAPEHFELLPGVVRRGDVVTARRALRLAMDRGTPYLREMAAVALTRGELGGLGLAAARQSGMHPDDFCWKLLGDPALGADAARMLAQESNRLLAEISARVDGADALARLRMLLALRLRATNASREMLTELVEAPWLSAQQRREVLSWF